MRLTITILMAFVMCAESATVRLYFVDPMTNEKDTNAFYVTPIGTNVLSNGGVVGRGITTRYVPASNGYRTNTLAVGHYSITNRSLGSGVVIRVPESSSLYDYTNLLISGYNIFVTVTNGESGGTSGALTNNETRALYFSNTVWFADSIQAADSVEAVQFIGGGASLTGLSGTQITSGTISSNKMDATAHVAYANDVTQAGLAAGSYDVSTSGLTNSIRKIISGGEFTTRTNITSRSTFDAGNIVSLSHSAHRKSQFTLTNCELTSVTLSNRTSTTNGTVLGTADEYNTLGSFNRITLRDIVVISPAIAATFSGTGEAATITNKVTAHNSRFVGGNNAVTVLTAVSEFYHCEFDTSYLSPTQAGIIEGSYTLDFNDFSTNTLSGCTIRYGGSAAENVGAIFYHNSSSVLSDCTFIGKSNSPQSAIYAGELAAEMTFNHCLFNLAGGSLLTQYGVDAADNVIRFNDCFIYPYTNGVIVELQAAPFHAKIFVRGGNIKPEHFSNPELVTFDTDVKPYAQLVGQTTLTAVSTGQVLTNYTTADTYGDMFANAAAGVITNASAGNYRVALSSVIAVSAAPMDLIVRTNLVNSHIRLNAIEATTLALPTALSGILRLPANCRVDVLANNDESIIGSRIFTVEKQ